MDNSVFLDNIGGHFGIYEDEDGKTVELETWTSGGVNMHIILDEEDGNYFEQFKEYVDDFDIDEEIDLHRDMKGYKEDFTIAESFDDFKGYLRKLKGIVREFS